MELGTELSEVLTRYFSSIFGVFKKNSIALISIASIFSLITVIFYKNEALGTAFQIIFVILFPIIVTCITYDSLYDQPKKWSEYIKEIVFNKSTSILLFFFITLIVSFIEVINLTLATVVKYFLWTVLPFIVISGQGFFNAIKNSYLLTSKDMITSVLKYIFILLITFLTFNIFTMSMDLIANNFVGSLAWEIRQFILLTMSLTCSSFLYIGAVIFYKDKGCI